jgi:hypothetical protein
MRLHAILQIGMVRLIGGIAIILLNTNDMKQETHEYDVLHAGEIYVKSINDLFGRPTIDMVKDTVYVSKPLDQANVGGNISIVYKGVKYSFLVTARTKYIPSKGE